MLCINLRRVPKLNRRLKPSIGPEPRPVDGARWIRLTKGFFTLVDATDFARLHMLRWCVVGNEKHYSAGHFWVTPKRVHVQMHRMLLDAPEHMEVDHRNGNPLDNRRENLRLATRAQNTQNRCSANRSGYKGVVWRVRHRKWIAKIKQAGCWYHLGQFEAVKDAARAYDVAARQRFGEFARLNVVD